MALTSSDEEFWEESELWESPAQELTLWAAPQPRLLKSSHRRHDGSTPGQGDRVASPIWLSVLLGARRCDPRGGPTWNLVCANRRMWKRNGKKEEREERRTSAVSSFGSKGERGKKGGKSWGTEWKYRATSDSTYVDRKTVVQKLYSILWRLL